LPKACQSVWANLLRVVATPGAGGVKVFNTAWQPRQTVIRFFDGYVAPLVISPMFWTGRLGIVMISHLCGRPLPTPFAIATALTEEPSPISQHFIELSEGAKPGKTAYMGNGLSLAAPWSQQSCWQRLIWFPVRFL